MNFLQKTLKQAVDGADDVSLIKYSGRGMHGRSCVGLSGPTAKVQEAISIALRLAVDAVVEAARDSGDEVTVDDMAQESELHKFIDDVTQFAWDTLGYDVVFYWKDIEWTAEEEQE